MTITFSLNIFGQRISTFEIRADIDQAPAACKPVIDKGVKRVGRWWAERMSS